MEGMISEHSNGERTQNCAYEGREFIGDNLHNGDYSVDGGNSHLFYDENNLHDGDNIHNGDTDIHNGDNDIHNGDNDIHNGDNDIHNGDNDIHNGDNDIHNGDNDIHNGDNDIHNGDNDIHNGDNDIHNGDNDIHNGDNDIHNGDNDIHNGDNDIHNGDNNIHNGDHNGDDNTVTNENESNEYIDEWTKYFSTAPSGWKEYWETCGEQLLWKSWCERFSEIYSELLSVGRINKFNEYIEKPDENHSFELTGDVMDVTNESVCGTDNFEGESTHITGHKIGNDTHKLEVSVDIIDWNNPVWCERYQQHYWEMTCHFMEEYKKDAQKDGKYSFCSRKSHIFPFNFCSLWW